MSLWKTVGVAAVVALVLAVLLPHVPFVRNLMTPKPTA